MGFCDFCEEEMGIQHILYNNMKLTRRRTTCDCLDKQIPLKAIYEKETQQRLHIEVFSIHRTTTGQNFRIFTVVIFDYEP
jgi:hypothetical protein